MTYVVGYSPQRDDVGALELARQLARSRPRPIHVVTVVPSGWGTPVAGDTDRAYREWAAAEGERASAAALAQLGDERGPDSSASWVGGRSVPQALLRRAAQLDASILVVGSGEDAPDGRIRLTSKTDRIVHSSTLPVAIAPRGYSSSAPVTRVTVGFRDDDASWSLLTAVAEICRSVNAELRIVTFVVTPRRPLTTTVSHAETQVIQRWAIEIAAAQRVAADQLAEAGFDLGTECLLAEGVDWDEAIGSLAWGDGDVLVVGSSSTHRLAQVFLGSSATKIIRHSPVPVIAVPGTAVNA